MVTAHALQPYRPVVFIESRDQALKDLDVLASSQEEPIAIDTEFDSLEGREKQIVLWSYSRGRGERKVVLGELATSVYADWLCDKRYKKVFAQYNADAPVFRRLGLNLDDAFYADIVHMDFFVDENSRKHGLKEQVYRVLHRRRKNFKDLFSFRAPGRRTYSTLTPSQILGLAPLPDGAETVHTAEEWRQIFLEYSGDDAEDTILCFEKHKAFLVDIGYWPVYLRVDRPFTLVLMRCEERGVAIDKALMSEIRTRARIDELRAAHVFKALLGIDDEDFNLSSKAQLRKFLIEELEWPEYEDMRTKKTGVQQVTKAALQRWVKDGFETAQYLIERNTKLKLVSDITSLLDGVSEDSRLRSSLNQIGTISGRISSRKWKEERWVETVSKKGIVKRILKKVQLGANLQNVVGAGEKDPYGVRAAFVAPPGHSLIVADYSGFELTMAIHWASKFRPDSKMLRLMQQYKTPSAVHAYTAIQMARLPLTMADWTKVKSLYPDEYKRSKNRNFNLLYLGSPKMLAKLGGADWRDSNVRIVYEDHYMHWYELYPEIRTYQKEMIKHGYRHGWVPTISGRRQNVAEGLADPDEYIRSHWERKCTNGPCQGSAADIVKAAMVLIEADEELRALGFRMLLQVHDEIIAEAPTENAERCKELLVGLMKKPYARQLAFGEMVVEAHVGPNWLAAKG